MTAMRHAIARILALLSQALATDHTATMKESDTLDDAWWRAIK